MKRMNNLKTSAVVLLDSEEENALSSEDERDIEVISAQLNLALIRMHMIALLIQHSLKIVYKTCNIF